MPPPNLRAIDQAKRSLQVLGNPTVRETRDLIDQQIERLRALARRAADEGVATAASRVEQLLARHANTLTGLADGASSPGVDEEGRVSLEALVKLTGRPALRVQDDCVNTDDPQVGAWQGPLVLIRNDIPHIARAVGRIDRGDAHVGTGFLIADDLVMTNRHVLDQLTVADTTINFRCEAGPARPWRFRVVAVEFVGATPRGKTSAVHFANLDLAILRIDTDGDSGTPPPAPLPLLTGDLDTHSTDRIFVVGFPAAPWRLPRDAAGRRRQDIADALSSIFGLQYGVKYLSPGETLELPGALSGDPERWVFSHDATTLGGNSGSCVVRLGHRPGVIGLHFAGDFERANFAHALARVFDCGQLPLAVAERIHWVEE
jgi:serine protease